MKNRSQPYHMPAGAEAARSLTNDAGRHDRRCIAARRCLGLALTGLALICCTATMRGQVSISVKDGDWGSASTWSGGVPSTGDSVVIAHNVRIRANTSVIGGLRIQTGGTLRDDGSGNSLYCSGAWVNEGTFTPGNSLRVYFQNTGSTLLTGATAFYRVYVQAGHTVTLADDISASDFVQISSSGVLDASNRIITLTGTGTVLTISGTFLPGTSTVRFTASGDVDVPSATYYNMDIAGGGRKTLTGEAGIDGNLSLTAGLFRLAAYNLTLGPNATWFGTPSSTCMIVTNGAGAVRKMFSSMVNSFVFPVGDTPGTDEYSPLTWTGRSGAYSYVSVRVVDAKDPNNPDATNFLTRYWVVGVDNEAGLDGDLLMQYVAADVTGTESSISVAKYNGSLYTYYGLVDAVTHRMNASNQNSLGTYTGRERSIVRSVPAGGSWGSATTWSPARVPTSSDSVVITAANVNINVATPTCAGISIASGATLRPYTNTTLTVNGGLTNAGSLTTYFNYGGINRTLSVVLAGRDGVTCFVTSGGSSHRVLTIAAGGRYKLYDDATVLTTFTTSSGSYFEGADRLLTITGTWTHEVGAMFAVGTSTVRYNSGASQPVATAEYYTLEIMISSTKSLTGPTTVNNTLLLTGGTLAIGAQELTLNGVITRTGGALTGGATSDLVFGGNGVTTAMPALTLNNLTINRAAGISIDTSVTSTTTVGGTLTLTSGGLVVGARNTLALNGPIVYGSGSITGSATSNISVGGGGTAPAAVLIADRVFNLTLNRPAGITLGSTITVLNVTTLTAGRLHLDTCNFIIGTSGTFAGTPGTANMLVTDGSGEVRKLFASTGNFTFPLGDDNGAGVYTPVYVSIISGASYGPGAYVAARNVSQKHPEHSDPADYLSRYWSLRAINITGYTCSMTGTYADSDVQGVEAGISAAVWADSTWTMHGAANQVANQVVASSVTSMGDLTGRTKHVLSSIATGNWTVASIWDAGRTPTAEDSVIISAGHVVSINLGSVACRGILINNTATLKASTATVLTVNGGLTNNNGSFLTNDNGNDLSVVLRGRGGMTFGFSAQSAWPFSNLTITSGASYKMASNTAVAQVFTTEAGAYFHGGSSLLDLRSAWVQSGATFEPGTSVIKYSTAASVVPGVYHDVQINGGLPVKSLAGDVSVHDLAIYSGSLILGANTLTITGVFSGGGTVTGTPASHMRIVGAALPDTLPGVLGSLGTLTIDRQASVSMNGSISIATTLLLDSGALVIGAFTLSLDGTVTLNGGALTGGASSRLVVNPSAAPLSLPSIALQRLTINRPAGVTMTGNLLVSDSLKLTAGSLAIGSNLLTLNGPVVITGGSLGGGAASSLTIGGTAGSFTLSAIELAVLVLNRPAGVVMAGPATIHDTLSLSAGALTIGANVLTVNNVVTASSGTLTGGPVAELVVGGGAVPPSTTIPAVTLLKLTMDRSAGIGLAGDVTITGELHPISGCVTLGAFNVIFGTGATVSGSATASSMLVTNGSGEVRKLVAGMGAFEFPVGDTTGTADYSPIVLDFTGGTFGAGAWAAVRVVNARRPNVYDNSHVTRYWSVRQNAISSFTCDVTAHYGVADVVGDEQALTTAKWDSTTAPGDWTYWSPVNTALHQLVAAAVTGFSDFTGKEKPESLLRSMSDGDWNQPSTWSEARIPTSWDSVVVRHVVTMKAPSVCRGILITNAGTLQNDGTAQTLTVHGSWNNLGTFLHGNSISLIMAGRSGTLNPPDTVFGMQSGSYALWNVTIADNVALISDVTIDGQVTISSGQTLHAQGHTLTVTGSGAPPLSVSGVFAYGTSTVVYSTDAAQTITPLEYFNLETQGAGTKTLAGRTTIRGTVNVGPGSTLAAGSAILVLAGTMNPTPLAVSGTFDPGTSAVRYVADINQNVTPVDYHTLYLGRPDGGSTTRERYAAGSFSVYGDLVTDTNATFTVYQHTISIQGDVRPTSIGSSSSTRAGKNVWRRGATLRFFGTGTSVFLQNAASPGETDAHHFLLEKDTPFDTVMVSIPGASGVVFGVRDSGNVTITRGVLDMQGNFMTPYPAGTSLGTFTLGSEGTLRCGGYNNFPLNALSSGNPTTYFAAYAMQTGSTVEYYLAGAQVVRANASSGSALQYSNLRLSGSGKKSMQRNTSTIAMIVNDTLTLQSGCTFGRMNDRTSLRYAGTGVLQYKHNDTPALQALQIVSDSEFVTGTWAPQNLSIFNKKDVKLRIATSPAGGEFSKTLSGRLQFIQGKLILGRNDLTLTSPSYPIEGADSARFVVCDTSNTVSTSNPGWLSLACVNSADFSPFHIGTIAGSSGSIWGVDTSYNPIFIRTLQTSTTIKARVSRFFAHQVTLSEGLVQREWSVEEPGGTSSDADVICSWNLPDEGLQFVRPNAQLITYHNAGQDMSQVPSAIGTWPAADPYGPWFVQGRFDAASNVTKFKNNLRITIGSSGILPAQLVAFSAVKDGGAVRLSWRTASEYLNVGFDVERSWNGSAWSRIGHVDGQGTKHTPTEYSWIDDGLATSHVPMVWYRLRQIDVNADGRHSPVVRVALGPVSDAVTIEEAFPNPAHSNASILLGIPQEQRVSVSIVDALGREIRHVRDGEAFEVGTHLVQIQVGDLPSGMYFLRVVHAEGVETRMLSISH